MHAPYLVAATEVERGHGREGLAHLEAQLAHPGPHCWVAPAADVGVHTFHHQPVPGHHPLDLGQQLVPHPERRVGPADVGAPNPARSLMRWGCGGMRWPASGGRHQKDVGAAESGIRDAV